MGGFLGIGQSGTEKSATSNVNNIFNTGLNESGASETAGSNTLGSAADAFKSLLASSTPGRTQTRVNAAPAINAATSSADAARRQEAATGTGRTGGTAELNREQGATNDANVDNIISQQLGIGQQLQAQKQEAGAQGLEGVGSSELSNAAQLLGISGGASSEELQAASQKENTQANAFGNIFKALI